MQVCWQCLLLLGVWCLSVRASYSKLHNLVEYWKSVCDLPANNNVLVSGTHEQIFETNRSWSLMGETIHNIFKERDDLKTCANCIELSQTIAKSIKDSSCNLKWLGPDEICSIMDKYSRIYFIGDSMLRHMTQALYMLLTNDYRYGGFPRIHVDKPTPFECGCDGQFSENIQCRDFKQTFSNNDMRDIGACTHTLNGFNPFFFNVDISYAQHSAWFNEICTTDARMRFVFIQGGTEYDASSAVYWRNFLKPALTNIYSDTRLCPWKTNVRVVYSGLTAASKVVQERYPTLSDTNTQQFNSEIEALLKVEYPEVIVLNFWNLSRELIAAGRTSNGYHLLSDGNLIKAMTLLNAMKLMFSTDKL